MDLLFDLLYYLASNVSLVLPCAIGLFLIKRKKATWGPYKIGAALQIFCSFGLVRGMVRNQDLITYHAVGTLISTVVLLVVFFVATKKEIRKWSDPAPVERWYTCPKCGQLVLDGVECDCSTAQLQGAAEETQEITAEEDVGLPPQEDTRASSGQKRRPSWPIALLCILCAMSWVATLAVGYQYFKISSQWQETEQEYAEQSKELEKSKKDAESAKLAASEAQKSLQDVQKELEWYETEFWSVLDDRDFFTDNIGFIVEGSQRYHRYDCSVFQNASRYWAHNIEYCEYIGYTKHAACWNS